MGDVLQLVAVRVAEIGALALPGFPADDPQVAVDRIASLVVLDNAVLLELETRSAKLVSRYVEGEMIAAEHRRRLNRGPFDPVEAEYLA